MNRFASELSGSTRALLLLSAASAAFMLPATAYAQDGQKDVEAQAAAPAAEAEVQDGNEIIVTASKREQTLQEVPIAVSVTTAETLERSQIRDIKDLGSVVPSLRVGQLQSSANTNFFIRGFGNGANNAGIEPSVGVFIDGVYRSRSAAQIGDFPDVQRIEVLRGPQSTLFGKNASAGVISIITQKPKFTFGGNVEASYGNFDAMVLKGVITGPLSESVAVSFAGGYNKRDGYTQDLGTGNETNERNRWFVRGQVLIQPSSDLTIRLIGDYGRIDENCCTVVNLRSGAATGALLAVSGGRVNPSSAPFGNIVYNNFDSTNDIRNYGFSGQIDYEMGPLTLTSITAIRKLEAKTNQDSDFTSGDLLGRNSQDLNIKTFTQELRLATNLDGPFNFMLGGFYFNEKIKQANQIQWGNSARAYANVLVQGASGGALNIALLENTFGALEGAPTRYQNQFFRAGTGFDERYTLDDESWSIFSQADFEITDGLTLTGGVNYTKDAKDFSANIVSSDVFGAIDFNAPAYAPFRNQLLFQGGIAATVGSALGLGRSATAAEIGAFAAAQNATFNAIVAGSAANANANQNNPAANPLNGLKALQFFPPFLNLPNSVESGRTRDDNFSYTIRLAYDVSDQINVYAGIATGYKASSINLSRDSRPTLANQAALTSAGLTRTNQSYGSRFATPETATVYEAGLKGNWGNASANIAVFKQSIKGFQSNVFTGTGFFLANAGKQSTFGVEFEGMVKPVSPLTLNFSVTYLNPKYDDFVLSAFGNATGSRPAGIPEWSGNIGGTYVHEMGNGDRIIANANFHFESDVQVIEGLPGFITRNAQGVVTSFQTGLDAAKPFRRSVDELDASLTYAMQNGLELTIWGRNLLNDRYIMQIFDSPAQSGGISGYPNQPLTWGGTARFRF